MLIGLQIYYMAVSTALLLYALHRPSSALRAFLLGISVNVFPLALLPYMDMDIARLGGLPLVYLPGTAVGLALALRNGPHLPRRYLSLYVLMCLYLVYTICNTVLLRGISISNLVYWLAWPLNFLLLIGMAATAARMSERLLKRVIEGAVWVLVAACAVGIARLALGIGSDANFIPLMNRNGTVVLVALLFPLIFHVHSNHGKSRFWLLSCVGIVALCVALTYSRSGLVGLLAGMILYYWRFSLVGLLKVSAVLLAIALFLQSGIAQRSTERLAMTGQTISAMLDGREVDRSVGDHNRVVLVNSAVAAAKKHFWFGTGLGMQNYREGLRRAGVASVTSKSHNFYLSYFTELGLVGFALLLSILKCIHSLLPSMGSHQRAFRVSFLVTGLMMTMNEYILLPELWLFMGLLMGITQRQAAAASSRAAAGHSSQPSRRRPTSPGLSGHGPATGPYPVRGMHG